MASPDSRGREIETTSSWEEQQSPAAKGMDSGKDEIVGPVLWLIYHRLWPLLLQKEVPVER